MVLYLLVLRTLVHHGLDKILLPFVDVADEKYQLLHSTRTSPVSHVLQLR